MTRDEICQRYQGLVRKHARQIFSRFGGSGMLDFDDLMAVGNIGLIEAFDRFDASQEIPFVAFASYRTRGAIMDALRDNDTFSRRRRMLAKKVEDSRRALRSELGREPTAEECAKQLDMSLKEYLDVLDRVAPVQAVDLHGSGSSDGESLPLLERLTDEDEHTADHEIYMSEVKGHLRRAVKDLPEQHRKFLTLHYERGMSNQEIAEKFGISVMRVSMILDQTRLMLRSRMLKLVDARDVLEGL